LRLWALENKQMSRSRREDARLLSPEDHLLVSQTRQPLIKTLTDDDLRKLVIDLRERKGGSRPSHLRDASAAPTDAAARDARSGTKQALFASAIKRLNKELHRRESTATKQLVANAKKALAMKSSADVTDHNRPDSRTAGEGMKVKQSEGLLPIERQGERPVLERSRKVR
jgi:hypothetical protein